VIMKSKHQTLADILQSESGEADLYRRLGEFICRYAELETACHVMFDYFSGLRREIARSIMGGARLVDLISALTKVIEVGTLSEPQKAEFRVCVDHLNVLTQLRHKLIHRGATAKREDITSTNLLTAKSRETVEVLRLHISDLEHANSDLLRLHLRLVLLMSPDVRQKFDADFLQRLFKPWEYKPVRPQRLAKA